MTLKTRPVRLSLLSRQAAPLAGAKVNAQLSLSTPGGVVLPSYEIDGADVVPLVVTMVEDPDKPGDYLGNFWPNTRGDKGTRWLINVAAGELLMKSLNLTVIDGNSTVVVPITVEVDPPPYPQVFPSGRVVSVAQGYADAAGESASLAAQAAQDAIDLGLTLGDIDAAAGYGQAAAQAAGLAVASATASSTSAGVSAGAANFKPNDSEGLMVTPEGGYFSTPSPSDEEVAVIKRKVAGAAVDTTKRTPSALAVTNLAARVSNIEIKGLFSRVGFVNPQGALIVDANWGATELLAISNVAISKLSLYGHTAVATIAFYNAAKVFISGVVSPTTGVPVTSFPAPPANAAFVVFTCNVPTLATQIFSGLVKSDAIPNLDKRLGALEFGSLFTRVGFVTASGQFASGDANWSTTALLAVSGVAIQSMRLYGHPNVASVAFYTATKTFISGSVAASEGIFVTTYPAVPGNAAFVSFTCSRAFFAGQSFSASVAVSSSSADLGLFDFNYAKYAATLGYITPAGVDSATDANWLRTDFLALPAGAVINCNMVGHSAISSVAFYDAKKAFISSVSATSTSMPGAMFVQAVTAPANTAFARLSMANPATNTLNPGVASYAYVSRDLVGKVLALETAAALAVTTTPRSYSSMRRLKLSAAEKIMLYGDSISSTDYTWYKSAMEALTGAVVYNGGWSGASSAQLATTAKMQRIYDYQPNLLIAMTGGNDSGAVGTVGTFSGGVAGEPIVVESSISADYVGTYFIQSISHIIRKFQATYNNIRARAALTGAETEAEKTAKIDALVKPVLVFCTPLPQQRGSGTDEFSKLENWNRKRDAVIECCIKYKIHCIDLTTKVPFDMSVEPYYVGPTNMTLNQGVYFMDGVHPNKWGYRIIAEMVCAEIGL